MMKSGAFARLYDKWFMQPIAPRNVALGLPMSEQLQKNLQDLSDKPAFDFGSQHAAAASAPRAVGILGGMGPAAGADFVRLFVQACTAHLQQQGLPVHDQAYPEHWLVQLPMPDRSAALRADPQSPTGPAQHLLQGVGRMAALGVRSVAWPATRPMPGMGSCRRCFRSCMCCTSRAKPPCTCRPAARNRHRAGHAGHL